MTQPVSFPVQFVGAGPGDPDLLTRKSLQALAEADVVLHDRLITPEILSEIGTQARLVDVGKAGFGPHTPQETINALLVREALKSQRVVRLKSGDATLFGRLDEEMEALEAAGLSFDILPGITAASAAVAAMGQSLTRRGRNSSVRLMTGHDTKGFAEQDWRALAQNGSVAAIYMGAKAARFIQGRLLMHGADSTTPVSFVANASRPDQVIIASTLGAMAADLAKAEARGPVLTFFGLAPRQASQTMPTMALPTISEEFA